MGRQRSVVAAVALLAVACVDPAKGKPQAEVGVALVATTPQALAETERLSLDTEKSAIRFVGSKVTGSHEGGFSRFSGEIALPREGVEGSQVNVEIDMASVFSDHERLTEHLKSADFFDVKTHPLARFVSARVESLPEPDQFRLTGTLSLHGVEKVVAFPATIRRTLDGVSATSEFSINRRDFGIHFPGKPDDLIRDQVLLRLTLEAARPSL